MLEKTAISPENVVEKLHPFKHVQSLLEMTVLQITQTLIGPRTDSYSILSNFESLWLGECKDDNVLLCLNQTPYI